MIVRSFGKKIVYGVYLACLPCIVISLVAFIYFMQTKGFYDLWSGSLLAITLFFASCAIVLYFISQPPKHVLLPWDAAEPDAHNTGNTDGSPA